MASPLYKIPLVLATAYTTGVALTAPIPPPSKEENKEEVVASEKVFARVVRLLTGGLKVAIWGGALCENAVVLARIHPSHPLAQEVAKRLVWGLPSSITRCAGTTGAGYLRILCFCELGKLFTYEISIRDGHKLVTSGPYSVVRRPSYTALLLGVAAVGSTHAAPESWYRESGLANTTLGQGLAWAYCVWSLIGGVNLAARTPEEDAILRKEFGEEWEDYARRVPYRLIPGIY